MTIDQLIQLGILMVGVLAVMTPFHMQNVRGRWRDRLLLDKVWRKLKKHDRRVTAMNSRVDRLERQQDRPNATGTKA